MEKLGSESARHSASEEMQYHHLAFFISRFGRSCFTLAPHLAVDKRQTTRADDATMLFSDEMWMQNGQSVIRPGAGSLSNFQVSYFVLHNACTLCNVVQVCTANGCVG